MLRRIQGSRLRGSTLLSGALRNVALPVVSGTDLQGETLSVTNGTFAPNVGLSYTYQWWRADPIVMGDDLVTFNGEVLLLDAEAIPGATSSTYLLTSADVDFIIWCVVTATKGTEAVSAASEATGPIGAVYAPQTDALLARMTVEPNGVRRSLINDLIVTLVNANLFTEMDGLYILAAHDAQASRLNWVSSSFDLTTVSAPTFTTDRGYQGNGTSSYLTSGFNPTTAPSPKFLQNDGHLGVWPLTSTAQDRDDIGNGNSFIRSLGAGGTSAVARVNQASTGQIVNSTTAIGHTVASRLNGTTLNGYRNGAAALSPAVASAAPSNTPFYVCSGGVAAFSSKQIAAAHWGAGLTSGEVSTVYSAIHTYLQAIGASA